MRTPRFQRPAAAPSFQLTARDRELLRQVAHHRFLNSRQLAALTGGSTQNLLRRLQRLFQNRYLDRPRAQARYFAEEGSQPMVYALAQKGAQALSPEQRRPRYDNKNVKQLYLKHTLLIADVMIAFTKACRMPSAPRLLLEEDLAPGQSPSSAFHWAVTVRDGKESKRVGVIPDRTFALEAPNGERVLYFLEADRATMPLTRRSLSQSSMLRKLLSYEATWSQVLHRERFGFERFRVLVVTSSAERARNLADLCAELPRGRGLFLFTDTDTLHGRVVPYTHDHVLDLPWLTASGGAERIGDSFAVILAA